MTLDESVPTAPTQPAPGAAAPVQEADLRKRAKAMKLRHKAAKARVKARRLEGKTRQLDAKALAWEQKADMLDGVIQAPL